MTTQEILDLLLLASPLILTQLGLVIYALFDLSRRTRVRGPRWGWAVGLILTGLGFPTGLLVSGLYLAWGRHIER